MAERAKKSPIKIELTPEQQEQIQRLTGLKVLALDLTPEALEDRVVPGVAAIQGIK